MSAEQKQTAGAGGEQSAADTAATVVSSGRKSGARSPRTRVSKAPPKEDRANHWKTIEDRLEPTLTNEPMVMLQVRVPQSLRDRVAGLVHNAQTDPKMIGVATLTAFAQYALEVAVRRIEEQQNDGQPFIAPLRARRSSTRGAR